MCCKHSFQFTHKTPEPTLNVHLLILEHISIYWFSEFWTCLLELPQPLLVLAAILPPIRLELNTPWTFLCAKNLIFMSYLFSTFFTDLFCQGFDAAIILGWCNQEVISSDHDNLHETCETSHM